MLIFRARYAYGDAAIAGFRGRAMFLRMPR